MPATQPSTEFHALCHEHHIEMRLDQSLVRSTVEDTETLSYTCTEPDCLVHYNSSRGYFMLSRNGSTNELDMLPRVSCFHDGMPLYLAGVNADKRSFRLWKCPQCAVTRTNGEGLIGGAL